MGSPKYRSSFSQYAKITIEKATGILKVSGRSVSIKARKTVKISKKKAYYVKAKSGALKFKKVGRTGGKKITVNKKTGKITLKKGLKKGKYTVRVKITAAGDANHKAVSKTVKVKIRVK